MVGVDCEVEREEVGTWVEIWVGKSLPDGNLANMALGWICEG